MFTGQYQSAPQMGAGYANPYGNPYPQGTGYQFNGQPQAQVKQDNNLSQEEIQTLLKKENQFTIALTETERLRGICNHRTADGLHDALVEDPNTGECTCKICGYSFTPSTIAANDRAAMDELKATVQNLQNYLQTIKMIYPEMPKEAQRSFFVLIPLLDKIPGLFDLAVKSYIKKEGPNMYGYTAQGMPVLNMFRQVMNSVGPMAMGYDPTMQYQQPYMQQPQYNQYGQPAYTGQPYYDPNMMATGGYGYQNVPPTNGFGYNGASMGQPAPNPVFQQQAQPQQNPQTGYNPQTTGYAYNPNQPAQPNMANTVPTQSGQSATQPTQVQPQQSAPGSIAPDSQQATTDGNTTNVTAKFQA